MKITVIYGTMSHDSTYNYVQLLLNKINPNINLNLTEFFFPRDLPESCCGCFSCFVDEKIICPNINDAYPIMKSLSESNLIIFTSSSYSCDESMKIKSFLNTLSYRWMPHRKSRPLMSDKIGLVISTSNDTLLNSTTKVIVNSLRFWGIRKIYRVSNSHCLLGFKTIDLEKKKRLNNEICNVANKILKLNEKSKKHPTSHLIKLPVLKYLL